MWIVRQLPSIFTSEVSVVNLARIGVIILTVFVAFYKMLHLNPAWMVVSTIGWILCLYVLVISQMVATGKIKAKGAKKRRKSWLPFLFNK